MNQLLSIDWSTIVEICGAIVTTLFSLLAGPLSDYLSDRMNRKSWENILKEIEVFNRWIDEGNIGTIDRLYQHIEESINQRLKRRRYPAYWFLTVTVILLDVALIVSNLMDGLWFRAILPSLSLLVIAYSIRWFVRENARREAERRATAESRVSAAINATASHIGEPQAENEKLVRLECNDEIDARWVTHLSRGSIYSRRLNSEFRHAAREKAEDIELGSLVDRVMQLPTEPPSDEE